MKHYNRRHAEALVEAEKTAMATQAWSDRILETHAYLLAWKVFMVDALGVENIIMYKFKKESCGKKNVA